MALRFRRTIKVAPGVRLNLGKRGMSVSTGVRGASVTVGRRGIYGNVGVPGTGISYRTKLANPLSTVSRATSDAVGSVWPHVQLALTQDGRVSLLDSDGAALPPRMVKQLRDTYGERIRTWLQEQCEHWNQGIDDMLNLHLHSPRGPSVFVPEPFTVKPPDRPTPRPLGLLDKLFRSRREKIEHENAKAEARYSEDRAAWESTLQDHMRRQDQVRQRVDRANRGDRDAMAEVLADRLARIEWPRETNISFEIECYGRTAYLDVDLPEIEDMPMQQARVAARGLRISIKQRSETQRRKEYMTHIHAIAFRVVAETFAALPSIERVVFSGYSQRADSATGRVNDEYLISVIVLRSAWSEIDFENLTNIDVVRAFERFDLRRNMTTTGTFTAIEPFGQGVKDVT